MYQTVDCNSLFEAQRIARMFYLTYKVGIAEGKNEVKRCLGIFT